MTVRTAGEAKLGYVIAMGDELGTVYSELWQEAARLNDKWSEYVVLFGTKQSRVNLLNEAAPRFTRMIQDTLWDDVLLHIARLTDPPKSAGKDNLTVTRLPPLVSDPAARAAVETAIANAMVATDFCRDWRNRRIAHGDYHLALETSSAKPLAFASRKSVREALESLTGALDAVSKHYLNGETNLFDSGPPVGGAMDLLNVIDIGVAANLARQQRIESGQYTADDFKARAL